jgi:hypothetical protein
MASTAFEHFRFSFFEDPYSARQGLDTIALAQLDGEERTRAEGMLIQYLPDSRGVVGLGVLRSRQAKRQLVQLFEAERGAHSMGLIYLAKALWQIRPDPRWAAALIDVLASADNYIQRLNAALALNDVRDPATALAFVKALDDPKSLVRYHAARGLFAIHGLPAESKGPEHMMYRLMSDDSVRRAGGKRDILAAVSAGPSEVASCAKR